MALQIHIPLAKIDEEKRLVIGRAVQEVPDRSKEILDYASSRPMFEAWSKHFEEISGGLSKGNLRRMHDPKSASGKIIDLQFNDADKAVEIVAKVVDDNDWRKVLEGVYTGFSVGGSYAKKWKDPETGMTRYTASPSEISLVDNPCIPTARIADLVKADGTVGQLHLRGRARSFGEVMAETLAKRAPRPFAEVLAEALEKRELSEAELEQRREAGRKSAEKRRGIGAADVAGAGALGALTGAAVYGMGGDTLLPDVRPQLPERVARDMVAAELRGKKHPLHMLRGDAGPPLTIRRAREHGADLVNAFGPEAPRNRQGKIRQGAWKELLSRERAKQTAGVIARRVEMSRTMLPAGSARGRTAAAVAAGAAIGLSGLPARAVWNRAEAGEKASGLQTGMAAAANGAGAAAITGVALGAINPARFGSRRVRLAAMLAIPAVAALVGGSGVYRTRDKLLAEHAAKAGA